MHKEVGKVKKLGKFICKKKNTDYHLSTESIVMQLFMRRISYGKYYVLKF